MTGDVYLFDAHFLSRVASPIVNEVKGICLLVCGYTWKPPETIEWE
jgi:GMP synthase (glutamine-hydrolysing)